MIDSLKASEQGLKIVDEARRRKRWQKIASIWVENAKTSEATLKRFWARKSPIDRYAFIEICKAVGVNWEQVAELTEIEETELLVVAPVKETPSALNLNFVGRENAIAHLSTRINQGSKIILIQAPGGVGKTTLAQEYLKSQGFDLILELLMAKEKENITLVESVIEEWLKRDFQEEPGREFGVTLGRLKRQLQTRRVGVLIDNLEPALDGQGKFIEPHRRYVELLRVLADSSVQSLTLITSREPLAECVGVTNYPLPSLDEKAWQDFFSHRDIEIDAITLKEMHKAYGGNALAMTILCDPIQRDGGMVAYWQEHKVEADLLVELAVENLVKEQFNRLKKTSPEAYRLLCRLGCYRYQDVPTVPTERLLCLLWDVPEAQRRRVIESLRNRSLVEFNKGEYWLHPVIRTEAISRLRESEDWKITNQTAAEFWTESVKTVETIADAKKALEAYYHYFEIKEFDLAGRVFVIRRSNKWTKNYRGEYFGGSLYRFGLLQQTISEFNQIIDKIILDINTANLLIELYLWLGESHYAKGEPNRGIDYHKKSQKIASIFSEDTYQKEEGLASFLKGLYLVSLVNIGYGYISLGEVEAAKKSFEDFYFSTKNTELHYHSVDACYFLAFCNSCLGLNQEAHNLAEKAYRELSITEWQPWSHGCALVFLGLTYKSLGEISKAFELFQRAIKFAEDSYYIQIKGQAYSGLAELYRIQGELKTALSHHSESIELLDKIGAKCDLAEAYYQLGLTYQTIGNTADSQENFNNAIQLFTEMEAPRQVEKVQQSAGKLI
ncbi:MULTISPECIES: tetratricopeptide repeat protein [Kamptonema]|uniref:tetratricopeptide repeat protein n=1 Tax=Kamptonema TaxID=1501433 RepID=UPI0001DAD23E|nr:MULTISPECIES: tetratricopeptide repeat protein [Kamptonema]CBN57708.1 TPR repeat-containing protein [Kamptonema sp. PCC 6506]